IYSATPLVFWVAISVSVVVCVLLLFNESKNQGKRWLFALGILMVNGILVLQLSMLRGYYAAGTDTLVHIGYVKDLVNGIISAQNAYPAVHGIPTLLVLIGLSAETAVNISPSISYVIYVASIYGLARIIWSEKRYVVIATTLSAFLLLPQGVGFAATLVAAVLFPATLMVMLKLRKDFKVWQLAVFLLILAVLSLLHPIALEVTIIAMVVACFMPLQKRWRFVAMTVLLIPLAFWWYAFWYDMNVVSVVAEDIMGGMNPLAVAPPAEVFPNPVAIPSDGTIPQIVNGELGLLPSTEGIRATQVMGNANMPMLLLSRYGAEILLGILAIVALFGMAKAYAKKSELKAYQVYFGILFIVFNLMWVGGWYLGLPVYNAMLSRILNWVPVVSIILVTPMVVASKKFKRALLVILLLAISVGSFANLYPSPITGVVNSQITYQHYNGIEWLVENGDPDIPIVHLGNHRVSRFVQAMYGMEWARNNQKQYWLHDRTYLKGFSYNDKESIGMDIPKDVYLVVLKSDRTMTRWENDQLYLLESDPATTLIYQDGDEFEVWFVESYELDSSS
ncbi:hypothetical protein LCGC14_1078000, partial [marine sediment metagenome]